MCSLSCLVGNPEDRFSRYDWKINEDHYKTIDGTASAKSLNPKIADFVLITIMLEPFSFWISIANSEDPDVMLLNAELHQVLHCLLRYKLYLGT